MSEKLALLGGPRAVTRDWRENIRWPIITEEDEAAVLEVLRTGDMSGTEVTKLFEAEFSAYYDGGALPRALQWHGVPACRDVCLRHWYGR